MFEYTIGETNLLLTRICRKYPGFTAVVSCSDDDILRMIISMRQKKIEWEGKIAMTGFGNLLAEGTREAVARDGLLGALTGPLRAASGGIGAAILFGLLSAVCFRPKEK